MRTDPHGHSLPEWLIFACGVWLVGLALYFIFVRPALLPEDLRYIGFDPQALASAAPNLGGWLGSVFTVMGGFMAGAGVLVMHFGLRVMPARIAATGLVLAVAGTSTVGLMSAVNFALHSEFRWVLVVPPIVWAIALVMYSRLRMQR